MLAASVRNQLGQLRHRRLAGLPTLPSAAVRRSRGAEPWTQAGLSGGEEFQGTRGRCLTFDRGLEEVWPGSVDKLRLPDSARREGKSRDSKEQALFVGAFPQSVLFFDLETCGFAGSPVFLIGALAGTASGLRLRQWWARNYAEESVILEAFAETCEQTDIIVSFNGKSFDWPQVRDRGLVHRVPLSRAAEQLPHWDLLPAARRRWRKGLPNCRLQTLESHICGRPRSGDLPSQDVPEMYHRYVRTRDMTILHAILHHNALDLVTLAELACLLTV